jgi:hypothetical protein
LGYKRILICLISVIACSCNYSPYYPPHPRPANLVASKYAEYQKTHCALPTGWYFISDSVTLFRRVVYIKSHTFLMPDKDGTYYQKTIGGNDTLYINPIPIVTANDIAIVKLIQPHSDTIPELEIVFYDDKKSVFWAATHKALHKRMGFIIDDSLVSAPEILEEIPHGVIDFSGSYNMELIKFKLELEMPKPAK